MCPRSVALFRGHFRALAKLPSIAACQALALLQAAYHGVPIVGMPLWGEQPDNVARAVEQGFGTCVSIDDTQNLAKDLQIALQRVLGTPSFAGNASRVSRLIQASQDSPARQAAGMMSLSYCGISLTFFLGFPGLMLTHKIRVYVNSRKIIREGPAGIFFLVWVFDSVPASAV